MVYFQQNRIIQSKILNYSKIIYIANWLWFNFKEILAPISEKKNEQSRASADTDVDIENPF